jgi:hypothetical protein
MTTSRERSQRSLGFWIGVFLIAVSFGIYPAYPTIALLPISANAKIAGGLLGSVASWTLFCAGSVLAGKEGREILHGLLARWRAGAGRTR